MRYIMLILICLTTPVLTWAGAYTGRVTDEMTGDGLPGAKLTSLSGETAETDEQGFFTLECHQEKVLVQLTGFQEKIYQLKPEGNVIALGLKGVYDVQTVQVKAKPDDKKVFVSKQKIAKEAIKKTTTSIFPDVAHVVQTLPGVTTDSDFSGLLYVRGGNPDEVVAFLDDMIIMSPYMWGGRLTIFNPNLVDSVDFYAGGYPAEANQAMSALMDVKNKTGNPDKFTGFLDLSAATANVVVEGPLGLMDGSSFIVGIRRTHYDLIVNAMGEKDLVYPYFWDGQAKLSLPMPEGTLEVQSIFSNEGMNLVLNDAEGYGDDHEEDTRFKYQSKNSNTSISYNHKLSDNINVLTLFGLRYEDSFYTMNDTYVPMDLKINLALLQARHVWQALIGDHHILKAGLYGITGDFRASINMSVKTPTLNGYHIDKTETKLNLPWPIFAGFFVQDDIELIKDSIYLNPGVNMQYYSGNRQWVANPRFAVKWKVLPAWEWHVATGIYSQHPMEARWLDDKYGNPELKAQESIHYILGTKVDVGEDFYIQAEGFYKDYRNLLTDDADPDINYTNHSRGYAYGFDLIMQKKLGGRWDGWLTYSYVKSKHRIDQRSNPEDFGLNPPLEPLGAWYTSGSERTHAVSLILNYELTKDWKIALTQKYMTGTPYTPVTSADYVPYIDEYVPTYGNINSDRFPDYTTTDIKITMPFFGLTGWSSYLQVTNLFNVKNVDEYYYSDDYSEQKALYQLPRMIIGGIRWDF